MSFTLPSAPEDTNEEISALVDVLRKTEKRLEDLTAGEVDAVAGRDGRIFLLRRAQDQLREREAAKQAAILNALPANIALLDTHGFIVSVNEAWQRFSDTDAIQRPGYAVGANYLSICDSASKDDTSAAHSIAAGIRSVLSGAEKTFSLEYPFHSLTQQCWFMVTVTPLAEGFAHGAVLTHLNVTAEREIEDRLRTSESRFRQMAENIRDVFFLQNLDRSQVYYVSPAYARIWGHSCESLYANPRSWSDAIHPDDRDLAFAKFKEGRVSGSFDYEFRIVRPDAQTRWIHVRGYPIVDDAGNLYRIAGVAADITERKHAQAEATRLFGVLEASLNEIYIFDAHTLRFDYVNDCARRNLGYSMEVMRRQTPLDFKPEFTPEKFDSLIAPLRSHERQQIVFNTVHRRADTSLYPVEVHLQLVERSGKAVFLAVINDITERTRAEQALRTSMEEFRTLAEAMPQIVWITRADGWNIYFNRHWMEYTGLTLEQSVGHGWNKPFHPDDQQRAWDAWQHATTTIGTYSIESRLCRADGVYRWWLVRGVPLQDAAGNILKWFGTCTDIHDLKMAELEVTESNRALRKSEIRIKYMNRVYAMLSGINTLIVRVRTRDELFREACRIAVDDGGLRMALICVVDRATMKIVPVASAGKNEALMTKIKAILSTERAVDTMVARAIREGKPVVANDSQNDPRVLFNKHYAESGVRSMAVFPLIVATETIGAVALYATESEFFHEEELKLLTDLTDDIAFGIDHIEKQERLDYLAYYDVLTGLANRVLFHERLARELIAAKAQDRQPALLLLDIERFKTINDTLGRSAGDALLKAVAARMADYAGDVTRLARIDVDHFAILVSEVKGREELAQLIEQRVVEVFGPPFRIGNNDLRIAAKFGIAIFPGDGADVDTLFRNAEAALKNAKGGGERYAFYTRNMNARVAEKLALENQLRQAIEKNEFVLHYQPKVNLASGAITGAEALIRWNDPRTGLVAPGEFIPILEETGLINEVGRWALHQALADYLRWRGAGCDVVRIAVNVSPLQLRHRGFVAEIAAAIAIDASAAAGLELEITESLIMEDVKHSIVSLHAIRALGVTIAIDDFGTGFSSLSYLSKLPVDTLKIDRSFVIDMTVAPEGLAFVSTIVNLAHSLKLNVVAEGVETAEQSSLLRQLGCDEMQGFLFSKPVPREVFEARFLE